MALIDVAAYLGGGLLTSLAFHAWLARHARDTSRDGLTVASDDAGLGPIAGRWLFWVLLWPLGLVLWLVECHWGRAPDKQAQANDFPHLPLVEDPLYGRFAVRPEHLVERLTVAEVEARERVVDPLAAVPAVPFGHLNPVWQKFVASMHTDHELWSFGATLTGPAGAQRIVEGYALVQAGEPVQCWFTADFLVGQTV